jgi:hypothetical protein
MVYGTDNFDLNSSHVLPMMIQFHEAKLNDNAAVVWGTGNAYERISL